MIFLFFCFCFVLCFKEKALPAKSRNEIRIPMWRETMCEFMFYPSHKRNEASPRWGGWAFVWPRSFGWLPVASLWWKRRAAWKGAITEVTLVTVAKGLLVHCHACWAWKTKKRLVSNWNFFLPAPPAFQVGCIVDKCSMGWRGAGLRGCTMQNCFG